MKEDVQEPAWAAILSLTLGTFALVTSEFLPASLLSPMAADLHISEGVAGQAVTVTALVGALVAPTIAIATRRFDRRHVMLTLSALLIMSNSIVSLSQSIQTLLVARIFLGTALAGFWAMSAAMAARLVPAPSMAKAMSLIFAGASAATVCAVPTGAFIGAIAGWRTVFVIGAVLGAVALIAQMIYLPRMRPTDAPTFGTLRDVALRPRVKLGLVAVVLIASGHFAGFTYIRPLLERMPELSASTLSAFLLVFGLAGFAGNFAGGWLVDRSLRVTVAAAPLLLGAATISLAAATDSITHRALLVTLWGFAFGAVPIGLQTWMARAAPDHLEAVGGLFIATFQVAIAFGAGAGGVIADLLGIPIAVSCGGAVAAGAGILIWRSSISAVDPS